MFSRPYGTVSVLIGMASRSLHCKYGLEVGELRLNRNMFSPGLVLTGSVATPQGEMGRKKGEPTTARVQSMNFASTSKESFPRAQRSSGECETIRVT